MLRRRSRSRVLAAAAALGALAAIALPPPAGGASMPAPDITKMDYSPIGFYKPGDPIPSPLTPPTDPNPSGRWNAYDLNVYESLNFPSRQPGDTSAKDPPGSGDPRYGFCPPSTTPNALFLIGGKCANHQLEWLDHYERVMKEILGDFGVVVHRYPFISPGRGTPGEPAGGSAAGGQAYNISATVPGAEHPEQSVLVSGHYDFTDSGPAAAWDSSEGHATVVRIAAIMADYWRKTGTRPSATVKFIPWDSEESGTFGSIDYVQNNIPPDEEDKVRGYFNLDPCAGAYPAYRYGNPATQVPIVLQLADPALYVDEGVIARITKFNGRAETIVDEVFNHLDDRMETVPGSPEIFVSDAEEAAGGPPSQRASVVTALGGLLLFGSDYTNFQNRGIPVFNMFPDYFGPHADGTPASAEGAAVIHTPRDNLTTINALTSTDQSGLGASEGWAKGLEMCAHMHSWYMLQPEMGGAELSTPDPVAYFEALPNEAIIRQSVTFDARGSYQYTDAAKRLLVDGSKLRYTWDFGDGATAVGPVVEHAYRTIDRYTARLTVSNIESGARDSMTLPIEVVPSNILGPILDAIPAEDEDGRLTLTWAYEVEPDVKDQFSHFQVDQSQGLKILLSDDAEGDITRLWEPSETGDPQLQPWQSSNGSLAINGNKRHAGESSYWTGAVPTAPSPASMESILTLRQPLSIPARGDSILSYWSLFQSEGDDQGVLEAALDDGNPATELRWEPIDGTAGFFAPVNAPPEPEHLTAELERRVVNLARYRGRSVLLRFRYVLGAEDRAASQPAGWYIDDLQLESGVWQPIGRAKQKSFEVPGRPAGLYGFRVLAVYAGSLETAPSATGAVRVTTGVDTPPAKVRGKKAEPRADVLPGTGVAGLLPYGLALFVAAAAGVRYLRRR